MARFANKTFFKFLLGFLGIVMFSFVLIIGTSYLAQQEAENNIAQVADDTTCTGVNC